MNNFEIIKCIKMRRLLWDKTTWDKTDVSVREDLWDEIAEKLMCSKEVLKTRWKNLRDSYRKILKKMDNLDVSESRWPCFNAMEFMRDITLNIKPRSVDITARKSDPVCLGQSDYSISLVSAMDNDTSTDPLAYPNQSLPGSSTLVKPEARGVKRHASDDLVTQILGIESEPTKYAKDKQAPPKQEDDDYQFLLSLHPHLRLVPPNRKFPLRMKIEQLIYDEIYAQTATSSSQKTDCSFQM